MRSSVYFITDCHCSEENFINNDKILSFARIIQNDSNNYIYLAVSGDIAFSGKTDEYNLFIDFFNRLKERSKKEIRLITCPGNHDIDFKEKNYNLSSLIRDTQKENVDDIYNERKQYISSYLSFEKENVQSNFINNFLTSLVFKDDNKEIVFYSLDNVFFSCFGTENKSSDTKNYAYLSETTISNISRKSPNQIVFLLMHFPVSYFNDEIGHKLKTKLIKNVDVVLNGHLHVPENELIFDEGTTNIIQGNYFCKKGSNKSSFVKIDLNSNYYGKFEWDDESKSYIEENVQHKLELKSSRWNSLNISFNDDCFVDLEKFEVQERQFNIEDLFVFPYLNKAKYLNFDDKESSIKDFNSLLIKSNSHPFIFIYGDESSGKTSLSKYLTLLFFNENYFPLLFSGDDFHKINEIERLINSKIRSMYSEKEKSIFKNETLKSQRVIIIDDFSPSDIDFLSKAREFFDHIIVFLRTDENNLLNKPIYIDQIEVLEYTIQPMLKSKRKEFTYKFYDLLMKSGDKSSLSKEQFFSCVEKQLSTLSFSDICDPISLGYIELYVFRNSDSFDNLLFSSVNQAKSILKLVKIIERNKINSDIQVIKRILSFIAYNLYDKKQSTFEFKEIKDSLKYENEYYGAPGVNEKNIINLMLESFIAKRTNDNKFMFLNRDIFSYYIAYFINLNLGQGNNDEFIKLLKEDIFVPLNFNILMCLSSLYNSVIVPNKIIDLINNKTKDLPLLSEENFTISGITMEKKEELKKLTDDDIVKINEKQDKKESEKHINYVENKDNLYYEEPVSEKIKEIQTLLDELKICCVLLKSFGSSLLKQSKEKLIQLIVTLPNIILYQYNEYLFKELDNLYAFFKGISNDKTDSLILSDLNNLIIDLKRAFILSIYDYGSRFFNDKASKDLLRNARSDPKSELSIVQNLMFESFLVSGDEFITSCSSILKSKEYRDNSFVKMSARLIAKRYITENYQLCTKKYRDFIDLVFSSSRQAVQYVASKVISRK
ncbi:MAG: metallophosphoesterase [Firmicutes bacterium]|nr:metallophosphoesterase [Candidatus Alectryobacillus merdavium]